MAGHTELMGEFIKFIINLVNLLLDGMIILKCITNECKKSCTDSCGSAESEWQCVMNMLITFRAPQNSANVITN
jgi:hypothetical protein